jgi:hsp70-interacting protein
MEMARSKRLSDTSEEIESLNNLRRALESRVEQIRGMVDQEELGAVKEERALIDSLWEICFHEPSQLRESGLLALPGDDEPPPDVASQLFEPALRAWSAPRPSVGSQNEDITATKPPLLLGG